MRNEEGRAGDDLLALNERLHAKRRLLSVPGEEGSGAPAVDPAELGGAIGDVRDILRGMRVVPGAWDVLDRIARVVGDGVMDMRRRCGTRGIDPDADTAAALMAWDGRDGWERFRSVLEGPARLIVVVGDVGTGKSCLAVRAVVEAPIVRGVAPRFVRASRLLEALLHPYGPKKEARLALAEQAAAASVLAIDDLGRVALREEELVQLQEVVTDRLGRGKQGRKTVITTNLTHRAFVETFFDGPDGRIMDRARGGLMAFVTLRGDSRRGQGQ